MPSSCAAISYTAEPSSASVGDTIPHTAATDSTAFTPRATTGCTAIFAIVPSACAAISYAAEPFSASAVASFISIVGFSLPPTSASTNANPYFTTVTAVSARTARWHLSPSDRGLCLVCRRRGPEPI